MTEVPKIVYDRLRAAALEHAASGPAHPDADLLTAFAEQALSATERDGVLAHLALCGDCREVVAVALPAEADVPAVPTTFSRAGAPEPRKLFAWPSLRWAALAAGIAVAASVLMLHPGKRNDATLPAVNSPSPVATREQPASSQPIPAPSPNQLTALARTGEVPSRAKSPLFKKATDEPAVTVVTAEKMAQAKQGILLADNKADNKKDEDKAASARETGAAATGAAVGGAIAGRANEVVEVTAESPALQAETSAEDRLMARSSAPAIEKAKPAVETESSQLQSAVSTGISELPVQGRNVEGRNLVTLSKQESPASPTGKRSVSVAWTIAGGVLQRSVDSGHSWQNALRADHSLLCYASHDQDVWAGGQAGALFHSVDSGVTWVRVQPSVNGQGLSSDITHIDLRSEALSDSRSRARSEARRDARIDSQGLAGIVLSTRSNETWSSSDAGKTWEKK
jgi:hypothetical protein